jgi:hemoglobin-like flavoprotein
MTPGQIGIVRETFAAVAPVADHAAQRFYAKLFERDPGLRALFPSDMGRQRVALMRVIGVAVERLDRLDDLLPAVEDLGRRHAGYGVRVHHYAVVGEALLDTLRERLGAAFTTEAETAWRAAYGLLATTMQAGARTVATAGGAELRSAA